MTDKTWVIVEDVDGSTGVSYVILLLQVKFSVTKCKIQADNIENFSRNRSYVIKEFFTVQSLSSLGKWHIQK